MHARYWTGDGLLSVGTAPAVAVVPPAEHSPGTNPWELVQRLLVRF